MIITKVTNEPNVRYAYLNIFPDQFKTEKEKQDVSWIKNTMDYFANVAYAQYRKHRQTFVKNYDLMKGIIDYTVLPNPRLPTSSINVPSSKALSKLIEASKSKSRSIGVSITGNVLPAFVFFILIFQ